MRTYTLDDRGGMPLYEYLYRCIRADILDGALAAGERLPSKRALAEHLHISVMTVEGAYQQLEAEGYVSLGTLDDSVKALKIDGAEATAENIKSGDYKVSRPFNIATKTDLDNPVADDFVAFIMSQEGQDVVSAEGYIPLDGAEAYAGEAPEGKAVVGGSSSVSPLMEKLIEAYAEVNPNAEIELQTTDSTTGMESAISGAYDIGMASREVKDEEIEGGLEAQVIATDGIAVVVNNNNPTDELSSDQVKSIYTGEALTWDEVVE